MKPDRLEPISLEDIVFLGEYVNDLPQFGLHIGLPDAYDIDRIKSEVNLPKESKRLVVYKIVSDCKETLGYCYYRYFHLPKAALIAVVVLPQHKRLGIGTETLAFLVEEIKSDARQIERVESVVASVNTTSLKALLNYGFVVEGVQHRTFRRPNLVADSILLKFDLLEPNLEVSNDL
jgi:RimJ/RimL family protein N-acetyltransferase